MVDTQTTGAPGQAIPEMEVPRMTASVDFATLLGIGGAFAMIAGAMMLSGQAAAFPGEYVESASGSRCIHDFQADAAPREREGQFPWRKHGALAGAQNHELRFILEQHLEMCHLQLRNRRRREILDQALGGQRNRFRIAILANNDRLARYPADSRCR